MSATAPAETPYKFLRTQVEQAFPWIGSWVTQPAGQDPLGRVLLPRDYLRTPFALSMIGLDYNESAYLLNAEVPWRSLQWVLQMYYAQNVAELTSNAPLHQAIVLGDAQGVGEMLRHPDAQWDGVTRNGHTALTLATLLGRYDMVELLLQHDFNVRAMDLVGNTALHWANIMRDPMLRDLLTAYAAPTDGENLFGGRPADYDSAWDQVPPQNLEVDLLYQDGTTRTLRTGDEFHQVMGFDYLPRVRPGIDFFAQVVAGMSNLDWLKGVHSDIKRCPAFPREEFSEAPMYLKDFGDPWGWGVCTRRALAKGEPVTSYVGDLVHTYENMVEVLNYGVNAYNSNAQPTPGLQAMLMSHFDAWRSGNFGSRINSAEYDGAQCLSFTCRFWRGLPRSQFYASRDIMENEQLSWFYGDGYWAAHGFSARPLPQF